MELAVVDAFCVHTQLELLLHMVRFYHQENFEPGKKARS